jgi:hypothetical protein
LRGNLKVNELPSGVIYESTRKKLKGEKNIPSEGGYL